VNNLYMILMDNAVHAGRYRTSMNQESESFGLKLFVIITRVIVLAVYLSLIIPRHDQVLQEANLMVLVFVY
jgi:hypothetical protein